MRACDIFALSPFIAMRARMLYAVRGKIYVGAGAGVGVGVCVGAVLCRLHVLFFPRLALEVKSSTHCKPCQHNKHPA